MNRGAFVGGLAVVLLCSCGQGTPGRTLAPVRGTVTFDGKPLANASIAFVPATDSKDPLGAQGVTDSRGQYVLSTLGDADGAQPGKYKVAITARGPGKKIDPSVNPGLPENEAVVPGPPLIPQKYFSADSSGLTADVPASGSSNLDFSLK